MTTIVPAGVTPTGERLVRVIDGVGELVFENYGPGEWMTQKGDPARTSRRRYLLDDVPLDSVSSIVDALRKIGLEKWKEDMGARGAVQALRMGELDDVPEQDIIKRVRALNLGADERARQAAARGHAIHAVFHGLAMGASVPNPADFPATARNWLRGAMCAWQELNPTDTIMAEELVCHPELGYAGRPDLVAVCHGKPTLIDYKTSTKGEAYDSAHWQTRLYAMALAALGVEVERIVIVGVSDNGRHEVIECEATEEWARALIAVFRAGKRIESGMRAQRAKRKAAAA